MLALKEDGKRLLSTSIVFLVLDVIAVLLRLIAKSKTKSRFALDDLWILTTLVVFAAWAALVIGSKGMNGPCISVSLTATGVVDVGGTYEPTALPAPLGQLAKIYKVRLILEITPQIGT